MCHETIWSWNAEQILNLDYENLFRYNIWLCTTTKYIWGSYSSSCVPENLPPCPSNIISCDTKMDKMNLGFSFVLLTVQHSCLPQMFLNMYRWDQILKKIIHYVKFDSLKIIDIYIFKFYSNIFVHEKYFFSIDSILTCIMSNVSLWARSTGSPKTI